MIWFLVRSQNRLFLSLATQQCMIITVLRYRTYYAATYKNNDEFVKHTPSLQRFLTLCIFCHMYYMYFRLRPWLASLEGNLFMQFYISIYSRSTLNIVGSTNNLQLLPDTAYTISIESMQALDRALVGMKSPGMSSMNCVAVSLSTIHYIKYTIYIGNFRNNTKCAET